MQPGQPGTDAGMKALMTRCFPSRRLHIFPQRFLVRHALQQTLWKASLPLRRVVVRTPLLKVASIFSSSMLVGTRKDRCCAAEVCLPRRWEMYAGVGQVGPLPDRCLPV